MEEAGEAGAGVVVVVAVVEVVEASSVLVVVSVSAAPAAALSSSDASPLAALPVAVFKRLEAAAFFPAAFRLADFGAMPDDEPTSAMVRGGGGCERDNWRK